MLVTDDRLLAGRDVTDVARAAVAGGATSVQLRLKQAGAREQVALARALVAALDVPVLVNDRPDVAIAAGAAGVHLGPEDVSVELARRIAPPGFIIGASVGSAEEAAAARGADYWGIGPWRVTTTKADAGTGLGPAVSRASPRWPVAGRASRSVGCARMMPARCSTRAEAGWRWCRESWPATTCRPRRSVTPRRWRGTRRAAPG